MIIMFLGDICFIDNYKIKGIFNLNVILNFWN